ncbi:MAG: MltA domain-containing protein [Rubrivivax sp.]
MLAALVACGSAPPTRAPAPVEQRAAQAAAPAASTPAVIAAPPPAAAAAGTTPKPEGPAFDRGKVRWVAASWADLPGFAADRIAEAWPALQASCTRPAPGWNELCARALLAPAMGDEALRRWLQTHLQPWRLEAPDGGAEGLATGYFEPTIAASRRPNGAFRIPLYAPPPGRPAYTRQQYDSLPAAQALLKGLEIAWIEDPLDALLLQVQGSGRLRIAEADGRVNTVRLAFAAHNDQPYRSLGRWLIEQGELTADTASWPAIKGWAQKNPQRLQELLWTNPRLVFFREEALPDPTQGPRGAQGVPLTPGRSVAVDPQAVPHGTPLWLDSTEPLSATPLRRLVVAQDSGAAITGPVRVDLFFGWGRDAEARAGRMKQPLRLWALWPRGAAPADQP